MKRSRFAWLLKPGLLGLLVSFFYLGVLQPLSILEIPALKTQDLFFAARHFFAPRPSVLNEMVLVTVDDESIKKIREKWPFPRRLYADFLKKLRHEKPRFLGFDLIFSEESNPVDDFLFSDMMSSLGNVILASYVDSEQDHVVPTKELRQSARGVGVVNKLLDRDLNVRRAHLFYGDAQGNRVSWPWEVELFIALSGLDRTKYQVTPGGILLEGAKEPIPFYDRKKAMINYRFDLSDVDALPFWQVVEARDISHRMAGKIVLIGTASKILHDYYHTPLGLMPGVVVNMNLLANLVTGELIRKIPLWINISFVALLVFLAAYLAFEYDILRGVIALTLSTIAVTAGFYLVFLNRYMGDFFTPIFSEWVTFLSIALYRYFHTFLENIQLRGKVVTDPLTGLFNRRVLESQIEAELEKLANVKGARKTDPFYELSILMIDIDDFKKINDTYGHQFGDDVLKNISFSIKENIRRDDVAARFGGEEFCVVLPHTNKDEAREIAEKIRRAIEAKELNYVNRMARFTVSIGVASAKTDQLLGGRSLIRAADLALYEAKKTGKNKVCLYRQAMNASD